MTRQDDSGREGGLVSRRTLVGAMAVGATVAGSRGALAQAERGAPPSTVTSPPRDFGPNEAPTTYFWDPDIVAVDPTFNQYAQPNSAIMRLWTGALWSEGAQGRYLVWSDIPNNRQLRWLEDNGQVSVFHAPSNHSNGNTFDFQGRQISCEHLSRRVVRYELDGSATVIADSYNGKRLNSPNDVVPPGRQHLVYRSALRRPALRGGARRAGRFEQRGGQAHSAARPAIGCGPKARFAPDSVLEGMRFELLVPPCQGQRRSGPLWSTFSPFCYRESSDCLAGGTEGSKLPRSSGESAANSVQVQRLAISISPRSTA